MKQNRKNIVPYLASAIDKHHVNVYDTTVKLDKKSAISILEIVQQKCNLRVKRNVEFYTQDAIMAVG